LSGLIGVTLWLSARPPFITATLKSVAFSFKSNRLSKFDKTLPQNGQIFIIIELLKYKIIPVETKVILS